VIANAAAEQLAGWPADNDAADAYARVEELIERSTDPERLRSAVQALRERPDRSDRVDFELAGSGRVFRLYSAPVRLDGDPASIIGRMFVTREVTEERDGERVKDEFIQLASHELRTPLTSILGYLEAVRDGEVGRVSPEQDRFLGVIERNAQRLLRLVGDLLLVSRVDAGRLGLEMEELDLGDLALECAQASQPRADAGQIALTVEAEPLLMHGDRTRLSEVVDNLLSNALKFTPPGGAVGVRVFASDEEAVLEVRDTGMGISDADQERLFERFFRAEAAMAAAIPGTGLGLCISKMLVEAHGGRIGVESDSDGGAVFRVSLPLARVPALTR
jgi:signal transduction histidine kinase